MRSTPLGNGVGVAVYTAGHIEYAGSYLSIERVAADCRARLQKLLGVDVRERGAYRFLRDAVTRLGGTIDTQEDYATGLGMGGSMTVMPQARTFTISLPRTATPAHNAFTLAHELGHLVLHYPLAAPVDHVVVYARLGEGPEEWQANRFASAFLMPEEEFRAVWTGTPDPSAVAARFGVMPVDAELRATTLGL